eukprot:5324089-Prymnesium_polylepis.1
MPEGLAVVVNCILSAAESVNQHLGRRMEPKAYQSMRDSWRGRLLRNYARRLSRDADGSWNTVDCATEERH